jgi:hypothetical protein
VRNVTKNIDYATLKECAITEFDDEKYVKQISKVCSIDSNRFSYKGNIYRFIDENGNVIEKNTKPLPNIRNKKIIETISNKTFNNIEECSKYFNISTGEVRDRIYNRIKNDKYKNLYNFELK